MIRKYPFPTHTACHPTVSPRGDSEERTMTEAAETLVPIEQIFNPNSKEYLDDPDSPVPGTVQRGRLVWYEPWQAWIMTRMPDIMACWKEEPLSSDFYDWEFAPAAATRGPVEQLRARPDRPQPAGRSRSPSPGTPRHRAGVLTQRGGRDPAQDRAGRQATVRRTG